MRGLGSAAAARAPISEYGRCRIRGRSRRIKTTCPTASGFCLTKEQPCVKPNNIWIFAEDLLNPGRFFSTQIWFRKSRWKIFRGKEDELSSLRKENGRAMTTETKHRKNRPRILIVDDSKFNIKILAECLKPDYDSHFATNGRDAIKFARSESPPDLILLDIMMPEQSGIEICRLLKSHERTMGIPVIFVTAKRTEEYEKAGLNVGAVDYIMKPFSPEIVKTRVNTHLELKRHREQLEVLVEERTRELALSNKRLEEEIAEKIKARKEGEELQAQLYQASKLEAIGTMAGGIAHDFNNMVGAILLNAELAIDDVPVGSEARYSMEQIIQVSKRAKKLIEQILTFSRRSDYIREPHDIREVVAESLEMLKRLIPEQIELVEDIAKEPCQVLANPTQVHQLIVNLGTNAVQAIGSGRGRIRVALEKRMPGGGNGFSRDKVKGVLVTVADDGCGIPKENLEKIFDPFFTTKPPGKGSGLGLSVVHGIVATHGGKMTVESEAGKGTVFRIFLPELETETPASDAADSMECYVGAAERILLVDDEERFVDANKRLLERLGYEVVAKTGSIEAMEDFRTRPETFDLAILDMGMPNMTGLEMAGAIHALRPNLPIILCTGYSLTVSASNAEAFGISELVGKPFDRSRIALAIRRALERKRGARRGESCANDEIVAFNLKQSSNCNGA